MHNFLCGNFYRKTNKNSSDNNNKKKLDDDESRKISQDRICIISAFVSQFFLFFPSLSLIMFFTLYPHSMSLKYKMR